MAVSSTTPVIITVRILHVALFVVVLVLSAVVVVLFAFVVHLIFRVIEISRKVHIGCRKVAATVVVLFTSTIIANLVAASLPVSIVLLALSGIVGITVVLLALLAHIVGRSLIGDILGVVLGNLATICTTSILIMLVVEC